MCLSIDHKTTTSLKAGPPKWIRVYKILSVHNHYGPPFQLHYTSPYYMGFKWDRAGLYESSVVVNYDRNIVHEAIHCFRKYLHATELAFALSRFVSERNVVIPLLASTKDIVGANSTEIAFSKVYLSPRTFKFMKK